jgi:O-methyltransferase
MSKAFRVLMQRAINRLGYAVHRIETASEKSPRPNGGSRTGHIVQYASVLSLAPDDIYTPWLEPEFREKVFRPIESTTVVSPDRCYFIERICRYCANLDGPFAECGVYRGGTAYLIASVLRSLGREKQLELFDSFAGMPGTRGRQLDGHEEGDFGDTSLDAVSQYLSGFPNVRIHPGLLPKTFEAVREEQFAFVHVDVDIYQSIYDCCVFFYPRLVRGGMMILDDYGFNLYRDATRRAADEFFANKPEPLVSLPTGQGFFIKL